MRLWSSYLLWIILLLLLHVYHELFRLHNKAISSYLRRGLYLLAWWFTELFSLRGFRWEVRINPTTPSISVSQHPTREAGKESTGRAHQLEYKFYSLGVYTVWRLFRIWGIFKKVSLGCQIWRVLLPPIILMPVYIKNGTSLLLLSVDEKLHFNDTKEFSMLLGLVFFRLVFYVLYFLVAMTSYFIITSIL